MQRIGHITKALEGVLEDANYMSSRLEAQEERLRNLRSHFESREHFGGLNECVKSNDANTRFEELRSALEEERRQRIDHHERIELLSAGLERQGRACEDLRSVHGQLLRAARDAEPGELGDVLTLATDIDLAAAVEDCVARVSEHEVRLEASDG